LKLVVLAVGKMRDRNLSALCDDYLKRARHHLPVEVIEVEDDAALVRRIPAAPATVVALEPGGESWTTAQLTAFLDKHMLHGTRALAFLIGGSDGLPREAVGRANVRLSLSSLTLPHRLARLVLCEQIYRALSILRDEPYSR
jgi:23S rRNA (pseudouridine1915-N3)-methyltransferase